MRKVVFLVMAFANIIWLGLEFVEGSVHEYSNGDFQEKGNADMFYGGSEGLYATTEHTKGSGVANGKSYIKFDHTLTFRRTAASASQFQPTDQKTGLVEAVIFEVADMDKIGENYNKRHAFCCTRELSVEIGCTEGQVIKRLAKPGKPFFLSIYFEGNDTEVKYVQEANITETGMYTLYFITCDIRLKGLTVSGKTIWKNPSGYLPGRMAPLMMFFAFLSLCYLVLGLFWLLQYIRFWQDILQLQNCITAVIGLGMCEMALWYFEYVNFNTTGLRPVGITFWAVTFAAIKKTVSRLLILVVSMGYGVVRPTLGGLTYKVILLGTTYFLASESLDIVENVGTINDLSGRAILFLVLPVAILDAFFILWIFTSLAKTLEKLQSRRQFAKLELYRKFTNALAISVIMAVAWIGYELYFKATDSFSERWQNAWIIPAFWNITTFLLLCVVCALWSPSRNSTRYAYSEEVGDDFDDDAALALTTNGVPKSSIMVEVAKTTLKDKSEKKDRKPVNTDVFSLDDDLEEDKRE